MEDSREKFWLLLSNASGALLGVERTYGVIYNHEDVLAGFTLVDAAAGRDVGWLADGTEVTLDAPATGQYGVRVETLPEAAIGSLRLELSGPKAVTRTDNAAPYTLYSEGGGGLPQGAYTLQATAYPDPEGGGTALQTLSVSFTVTAAEASNTAPTGLPEISGAAEVGGTLTASADGIEDADGLDNATFAWQWLANDGARNAEIAGATGSTYDPGPADIGKTIKVRATFTDDGGTTETATSASTAAVEAEPATTTALSATFPASPYASKKHKGADDRPQVVVAFSEAVTGFEKTTPSVTVSEASVASVQPHTEDGLTNGYIFFLTPYGDEDLQLTLVTDKACDDGGICTSDGTRLSDVPAARTIPGPEKTEASELSIADANANEGDDTTIDFVVTLDPAGATAATVDYATADGTATAGEDYTAKSGTLMFTAGQTSQTVSVAIIDDAADEDDETLTLTLTNAAGAGIDDANGTGTIHDGDAAPVETNTAATGAPTISGTAQVGGELQAATAGIEDADGLDNASFAYQWIRGETDIGGATRSTYTPADADEGRRIKVRVTFEDDAGNDESLTSAATATVGPKPKPLTATFENVPAEHAGAGTEFTFRLRFSEIFRLGYRVLRDDAFEVHGGEVRKARRVDGRNDLREIHVEPDANGAVSIGLPATTDCNARGAICTAGNRPLSNSTSATVAAPAGVSVGDAQAEENTDDTIDFTVSLDRAASGTVTVDYATSDGSATAGADYAAASGTLTFQAGERAKTVAVAVLDDTHNEGSETFTLQLSNAAGAVITDSSATGTITNHDALPAALVARFGRTAALHVVEQVEERVNAPRAPGFDGRVADRAINRDMGQDFALDLLQQLGGGYGSAPTGVPSANGGMTSILGPQDPLGLQDPMSQGPMSQGPSLHGPGLQHDAGFGLGFGGRDQLLVGSGFALNRATSTGGVLSFWSRSAQSSFHGQDGALALNGDVRSTMFGADYAKGRMVTGVSLAHTRGLGSYAGVDSGRMTSAVTGLYPWVGFKASERVTVWTVAGYGAGGLLLSPGAGTPIETGLSMAMAAGGGRGQILGGGEGFGLAFKADALWVGTRTDESNGPGGRLRGTSAAVNRLRTAIEGSQSMTIANRMALTPSVEVGIRQDGGDAETGRGMDLGAGLVLADGVTGLAVDIRVRRLLVHQADGFAESGVSISVSYDPTPSTPLGFTARVSPAWGGEAMSGAEALWGRESMVGMGRDQLLGGGNRLDTEVGVRPADRSTVRRNAEGRRTNFGVRPKLPGGLRHASTRAGASEPAARDRRGATGKPGVPPAGRSRSNGAARARAGDRAVVDRRRPAPTTNPTRPGPARIAKRCDPAKHPTMRAHPAPRARGSTHQAELQHAPMPRPPRAGIHRRSTSYADRATAPRKHRGSTKVDRGVQLNQVTATTPMRGSTDCGRLRIWQRPLDSPRAGMNPNSS